MPGDTGYKEKWAQHEDVYLDFIIPLNRRTKLRINVLSLKLVPLLVRYSNSALAALVPRSIKSVIRQNAPLWEYAGQLERL